MIPPGEICPQCERKVPAVHSGPPGPRQTRFSVAEPPGEEGVLDELLVQLVEKYRAAWPEEVGELGDRGWRYRALHFGLYTLVSSTVVPAEVGR